MREVPQIKAAYDWMVEAYQTEVSAAVSAGNHVAVDRLDKNRDALERGMFVVLFGQFEKAVAEYFQQARDTRAANPDWSIRRGWDISTYAGDRVPFETRLTLVVDKRNPSYGGILQAYGLRNHCPHGGTSQPVGSIDEFVKDLYVWSSLLRR